MHDDVGLDSAGVDKATLPAHSNAIFQERLRRSSACQSDPPEVCVGSASSLPGRSRLLDQYLPEFLDFLWNHFPGLTS